MRALLAFTLLCSCILGDDRNLSEYDVLGPFAIKSIVPDREADRQNGQVREFLWRHWLQHRRGTVSAAYQFVEGTASVSYFVEPDKSGRWVIVEYVGKQTFSCDEFERVEPDRLHLPLVPIPITAVRQPEQYLLHPICSKGKDAKLW